MTPEEVVSKVATRLYDGYGPADVRDGVSNLRCMYRTPYGKSCAVGCLIPDDVYDPNIEGTVMGSLYVQDGLFHAYIGACERREVLAHVLNASGIPATEAMLAFLQRMQEAHDNLPNWHGHKYVGPHPQDVWTQVQLWNSRQEDF